MGMSEWNNISLGKLASQKRIEIRTGPFGSQLHQSDYVDDGIPVVMPKDIIDWKISETSIARTSPQMVKKLAVHQLLNGDIVYGRRGDIGRHAHISQREEGWLCGTGCIRLRLNDAPFDSEYLSLFLRLPATIESIYNQAVGATMPNLNTSIIESIVVDYPDKNSQKKISICLSAYDNLIENNNRRIAILEEMAQKLYRNEVQKAEGTCLLGEVVKFKRGKTITKATISKGNVPVVAGGLQPAYYHNKANSKAPVLTVSASGANAGYVNLYHVDIWASDCSFIDANSSDNVFFYFVCMKELQEQINFMQRGSAQPHVYPDDISRLEIPCLPQNVVASINKQLYNIFSSVGNLTMKNVNLRKTRDLLIPALINGDIDVSDLPIQVEED